MVKRKLEDLIGDTTTDAEGTSTGQRKESGVGRDAQLEDLNSRPPETEPDQGKSCGQMHGTDKPTEGDEASFFQMDTEAQDKSSREECGDPISGLPDLVQDVIFEFLDVPDKVNAAQVCSSWLGAIYRPCHWRNMTLDLKLDYLSEEEVVSLRERKIQHVEVLIGRDERKTERFFQEVTSLVSLKMIVTFDRLGFLETLPGNAFSTLQKLDMILGKPPDEILQQSLVHFPFLHSLRIACDMSSDLIAAISRDLPGLKELTLLPSSYCIQLNIEGLTRLGSLHTLDLQRFHLSGTENLHLLDKTLKRLSFLRCRLCTDDLAVMLSRMPSLEELCLDKCIDWIGNDGLRLLSQNLTILKKFKLATPDRTLLDDSGLESLTRMTKLEDLCLYGLESITSEGYGLLKNLKHLKVLTLLDCSGIKEEGMKHIGQLSSLQKMDLCCGGHGDTLLGTLGDGSCKLKSLELTKIADTKCEDMAHISKISSLRELRLNFVSVGSTGMRLLSEGKFTLETLEMCGCGITVQGLMPLLERQISLRTLILDDKGIEKDRVSQLHAILPNLEVCSLWSY